MAACKDHLINIPIGSQDVMNTLESMPRTPDEAGLLEVKLKRKLEYKNTHKQAYVNVEKIYKALHYLKANGHPEYQFYDDFNAYQKRCQRLKIQHVDDNQVDSILEKDAYNIQLDWEKKKDETGELSDEDDDYIYISLLVGVLIL